MSSWLLVLSALTNKDMKEVSCQVVLASIVGLGNEAACVRQVRRTLGNRPPKASFRLLSGSKGGLGVALGAS